MNRLLVAAAKGYQALVPGLRGGGGWFRRGGIQGVDYNAEAGARIDSSVVYPAILFGVKELAKASIKTWRPDARGRLVEVPNHPITQLLKQPVPWYGGGHLRSCWVVSAMLAGNSYCLKRRSGGGKLRGLEYVNLGGMSPESVPGTNRFIDSYRLTVKGGYIPIEPEDVLHLRWHTPNPFQHGIGFSPLEAVLPEIAMDKRASRYEASMLRNILGAFVGSPEGKDEEGNPLTFGSTQREQLSALMKEEAGGDMVGSTLMMPFPMKFQQVMFSPKDMALEHNHNLSEERVGAAFNIPLVLLGLGSGLENTGNRAQYSGAVRQGLFGFTIPLMKSIGEQLTEDLVPELGMPGDVVAFDYREIPEYREYMAEANMRDAGGPWLTVNEVRDAEGFAPLPGGDRVRNTDVGTAPEKDPEPEPPRKDTPNEDEDSA